MPRRPCSDFAKTLTELAMNVGSRPDVNTLDDVVTALQKDIPELDRTMLVNSINEATTGYTKAKDELRDKVNTMFREARSDVALRAKIAAVKQNLAAGTLPPKTPRPDASPGPVTDLRTTLADLRKQLANSEPALREKYLKQIDDLTERLETGVELPVPRSKTTPQTKELERLVYQRDRLKAQIRQKINDLKPRSVFARYAGDPLNLARSVMTSMDFSGVLKQGGFIALGNPVRAAKSLGPMFQAFASPAKSHAINQAILARDNAPLYARSGLHLSPDETTGASLNKQEEAFMSRLAGKIPLVAGSQRAYVTFLNKLRADAFDTMMASLARDASATEIEAKAIANYINVATGRGKLGSPAMEQAAPLLNTIFFAPRYVASRFQILGGQPLLGGTARTRKLIAREYAKFMTGLGVVYALGVLAGGDLETDTNSSDFGKIRFGNTRLDPLAGLSQAITLVSRLWTGQTKNSKGKVRNLDGKGPFGQTRLDVAERFARSKLSPSVGAAVDLLQGENVVGEKTTALSTAKRLVIPMNIESYVEAMEDQGVPRGTALSILSLFGMGVNTYE